ncbi:MAG: hypothetical protein WBE01_08110 [Methyloceanibacter sp.]
MVDLPPPPPQPAFVEPDKSDSSDTRDRINVIRVTFAKARSLAQPGKPGSVTSPTEGDTEVAFDNFNQALPFQNFNQFANFNDFSNFNDFQNFNDFSNS